MRRAKVERHREPVLFGDGIEEEPNRVTLRIRADRFGFGDDLRTPVGDRDLAGQPRFLPLARDRRFEYDPVDLQLADIDIDIGEQRFARVGHVLERGEAFDGHRPGGRRADVDVIGEEGEWAPVDLDLWRGDKTPLRIRYRKVADDHLAIERAIEAADADLHPVFEVIFFDLGYDEAAPSVAVQADQEQRDERDRAQQCDSRPARQAARPGLAARLSRLGRRFRVRFDGHQNAWPIET